MVLCKRSVRTRCSPPWASESRRWLAEAEDQGQSQIQAITAPWRGPLTALSSVILAGSIGYRITEGWDWGDCLWMVLITISTIGYGEVHPLSSQGRLVTVLIVIGGLLVVQLFIQRVLGLTESGYFRKLREFRFQRLLLSMQDHVILCGYGRIGQEIAAQLQRDDTPLVVIETDPERSQIAESRGLKVLLADATLDETLLEAGWSNAAAWWWRCREMHRTCTWCSVPVTCSRPAD